MIGDVLQPTHLIFILIVALVVLGPKRLPEVGRSLGKGLRDFRQAISGEDDDTPPRVSEPSEDRDLQPVTPATTVLNEDDDEAAELPPAYGGPVTAPAAPLPELERTDVSAGGEERESSEDSELAPPTQPQPVAPAPGVSGPGD